MKNAFYFILKAFFVLKTFKYLSFDILICLFDILVMQKKRLDQKDTVNFEIDEAKAWLTNNENTHIAQDLSNKGNETIKLGQLIQDKKKIFYLKNHAENEARRLIPDLFLFFKKALYKAKASGLQLGFTIFRQPLNQYTIKANFIKLQTIDPEIYSILIFQSRVWEKFLRHILKDFSTKMFLMLY